MKCNTKVNLNITFDNQVYSYENVKFKIGGNGSRSYAKVGFNLKLKKNDVFLGRRNLRLRSNFVDITHIRSKVAVDLINKWNIPTVQETYANVYLNNKFIGLYTFLDAVKTDWIEDIYEVPKDEIDTLYSCEGIELAFNPEVVRQICKNDRDEYSNYTQPLYDMVDQIYEFTTIEELESKFENVENIRKILIIEYLLGAQDNFIMSGNNYNLYQKPNGRWEHIPKDFSNVFLLGLDTMMQYIPYQIPRYEEIIDYAKVKFEDWHSPGTRKPYIDILYYNDKEEFVNTLKELLITGFNPDELFARIDELAEFIAPYVERDITPDENGNLPGRFNKIGININYNMTNYWNTIDTANYYNGSGLKRFIQVKFDSVCDLYNIDKNEILKKAKLYRKQRDYEIKIYDLKQQIENLLKEIENLPVLKNNLQNVINKLFNEVEEYGKLMLESSEALQKCLKK